MKNRKTDLNLVKTSKSFLRSDNRHSLKEDYIGIRPVKFKLWQLFAFQLLLVLLVFQWVGRTNLIHTLNNYDNQLLTGFYDIENNADFPYRWTGKTAQLALPQPAISNQLTLWLLAPRADSLPNSKVMVDVSINDRVVRHLSLDPATPGPQAFTLEWQALNLFPSAQLKLQVLNTFHAPNDNRELGIIMSAFEVQPVNTGPLLVEQIIWPSLFSWLFIIIITTLFNRFFSHYVFNPVETKHPYEQLVKVAVCISLPGLIVFEPLPILLGELIILGSLGLWINTKKLGSITFDDKNSSSSN